MSCVYTVTGCVSDLRNMYRLLSPIQNGLGVLVNEVEEHIKQVGLEVVVSLQGQSVSLTHTQSHRDTQYKSHSHTVSLTHARACTCTHTHTNVTVTHAVSQTHTQCKSLRHIVSQTHTQCKSLTHFVSQTHTVILLLHFRHLAVV